MLECFGVFGGTFDPPHIGHQILAAEALDQLGLDKVLWVLTPDPPHKRDRTISPLPIRLEMVRAAIKDCPGFVLSRVDIDRPAPHYAIDTLRLLMTQYPTVELVYLIGGDSLHDLPSWYAFKEFVASCGDIGVMRRPSDDVDLDWLETRIPGITQKIRFVEAPLLEVAASQIRDRVRKGKPYRFYLPESVYRIIKKHKLYQETA